MVVGGSQCGAIVSKAHLPEYTAHEVPLPSFGLGYDWACTFRGAPLPRLGQASEFTFVGRLHPIFGFGYDWADASVNFVDVFIGR